VDPTIIVAIVSAVAAVIAGAFSYAGVRFTQRSARAAAEATADLERRAVDAAAFERARATWEAHVEDLTEQVGDLRAEAEGLRTEARDLRARVDEFERGRDLDRARIRELTAYARDLLRILAEHEITYPPPPEGLR
jgi:predicted RNase H-like nuclease (RuvC/YqgF family)